MHRSSQSTGCASKQARKQTKKYKEEKHKRSSPDQAVLHLSLQLPGMLAGAPPGLEHLNPSPSDLATTVGTEHHRLQQTDMAFFFLFCQLEMDLLHPPSFLCVLQFLGKEIAGLLDEEVVPQRLHSWGPELHPAWRVESCLLLHSLCLEALCDTIAAFHCIAHAPPKHHINDDDDNKRETANLEEFLHIAAASMKNAARRRKKNNKEGLLTAQLDRL